MLDSSTSVEEILGKVLEPDNETIKTVLVNKARNKFL